VSSLRLAGALLARTTAFRDLETLGSRLRFGPSAALDAAARRALQLDPSVRRAHVATGAGTLRALLVETALAGSPREAAVRTAARLATNSPQLLWLVIAMEPATGTVVISVPAPGGRPPVVSLTVDTRRVLDADAETLVAMEGAAGGADVLVHDRWRELLGRDALTRKFYRELESEVSAMAAEARGAASDSVRRTIALLYASRLLFLSFLEAKGWLDRDREFLRHALDRHCASGGSVQRRLLEPLFFGTLNTPAARRARVARALGQIPFLNGGLFSRTPMEKRHRTLHLTDDSLASFVGGLLARYRVTAREGTSDWAEAAVDPEMLGRAFESLMAPVERRASGTFYTPAPIIERLAGGALDELLAARAVPPDVVRAARAGTPLPRAERDLLRDALAGIRVLDPACGSGAFLVHALERLADLSRAAGDDRAVGARRREILSRSIFGVDANPTAVWLCELRLWLSVVIDAEDDDPMRVPPLPNLDRHIRVGDALGGPAFAEASMIPEPTAMTGLRVRYSRATGARKRSLARVLDREERRAALHVAGRECAQVAARRKDLLCALRSRDLFAERPPPPGPQRAELAALRDASRTLRRRIAALRSGAPLPFLFPAHFADAGAAGGFDLVIGNPPWVRLHNIPPASRDALRARYRAFRDAAWMPGAEATGAGRAFAAQADLAALFVERSLELTRAAGVVALLLPSKLWRSLAGGGVRAVVSDLAEVKSLEDWAESRAAFDAAVYPSQFIAVRRPASQAAQVESPVRLAVHRREQTLAWHAARANIALDDSPGAPWLLVPPDVRAGFDRLSAAGPPLARTAFGRPLLGVKSGCNEAFVVTTHRGWDGDAHGLWPVRSGARAGRVERHMLRPLVRGESVRAWRAEPCDEALIWTHGALGAPLERLPAGTAAWLAPWRRRLELRTDARNRSRWWSLFRTDAAKSDRTRVVWSDIGKSPRAFVLPAGDSTVPLNSCYVVRAESCDDAMAFCALLNSPVAAAWLAAIAEPARGGYYRFMGWTLARLPVPREWPSARKILAPMGHAANAGSPPDRATLTDAVVRAYRVRSPDIAALLTWCLR
jgi:hypothetical protein